MPAETVDELPISRSGLAVRETTARRAGELVLESFRTEVEVSINEPGQRGHRRLSGLRKADPRLRGRRIPRFRHPVRGIRTHFRYMVNLVGVDHVGIGTDTTVVDRVAFHRVLLGRGPDQLPAPYLNGLEYPADGKNIVRGLIRRGHSDEDVLKIVGGNASDYFRRAIG